MNRDLRPTLKLADDVAGSLSSPIERIAAELAGDGAFSAPVQMPPKDELTVRLVNVAVLERLDEARSDTVMFQNIFWALFGAVVSLAASVSSSQENLHQIDGTTAVAFAGLLAALATIGFFWRRYSLRASTLKEKILKGPSFGDAVG